MTYEPSSAAKMRLEIATFVWSASIGLNYPCPLSLTESSWQNAPVINGAGTGLTLPSGHYRAMAKVFATRASANQNIEFTFQVGGSNVGKPGQTDIFNNSGNCDQADATFSLTSSDTLELVITAKEGSSFPSLTSDCTLILWRTNL
jgi:hypothetical protein